MKNKKHKLHIISFDGLSKVDMPFLMEEPNFKEFLKGASYSFEVESVYPSVTYCAHTSITTGNYPNKHGIINNTLLQPEKKRPDWYWYAKDIKTKTFQRLATEAGFTILSILWPVSAGDKLKYNMPEIFPNRRWLSQSMVSLLNGSKYYQYRMNRRFGFLRSGTKEPELDDFIHASYIYSLKKYKTDITMVHYIDLDSTRHEYGFESHKAYNALKRHDKRLGEVVKTIKEEGEWEDSTIIVIGDHSSKDGEYNIYLNTLFKKLGYLNVSSDGTIDRYSVIAKTADGSTYIYTDGKVDLEKLVTEIRLELDDAIDGIYSKEEANNLGADPNCALMIEGKLGYFFEDEIMDEVIISIKELREKGIFAHVNNHGYNPNLKKDYETVFIAKGKGIKSGVNIGRMNLVDEGPTFARLLGLELKNVDGRVLEEILE